MTVLSSIDIFKIHEHDNQYSVLVFGWCVETKGCVPGIQLIVDGEIQAESVNHVVRHDACQAYQLDEDKFLNCGFVFRTELENRPKTIVIKAASKYKMQKIYSLSSSEIEKMTEKKSLAWQIGNVYPDKKKGICSITGWAFSVCDTPITYQIKDQNGNVIDSEVKLSSRPDFTAYGLVGENNKKCQFIVKYPIEDNCSYYLTIHTDDADKIIDIDEEIENRNANGVALTLKRINIRNIKIMLSRINSIGLKDTIRWARIVNNPDISYAEWLKDKRPSRRELKEQKETVFSYAPKFSIIVPTYNTPVNFLKEMVDSVRNQTYSNWQLCIADGSDPDNEARSVIEEYSKNDSRIVVTYLADNYGISGNTNKAMELATGDYIALFDHDDLLEPDALYEMTRAIQDKHHDIIYTDQDKFDDETNLYNAPDLKPDWNPDLFYSCNYICHFFAVKTEIMRKIGGFRSEYDGSQDYDLILRCTEESRDICHVAKIVYHWRISETSTAGNPESKMYAYDAGERALQDHFNRRGIPAQVEKQHDLLGYYHVTYALADQPLVTVVIPNCDHIDSLKKCINSLYEINSYKNIEIVVVENNSREPKTFAYYETMKSENPAISVVTWKGKEFNYAAINNFGVSYARGEYILLLNNDVEMIEKDSIKDMVSNAMRPEVGVVGAKLMYPDNTIQHAGIVIGPNGYAVEVFNGYKVADNDYMLRAAVRCDYSAVTGACLMTKKTLWDKVGGMDERFKVSCNDVDYCLKIRQENMLVVYDAYSVWHHYQSKSRGLDDTKAKLNRFEGEIKLWQEKWGEQYLPDKDPNYNPNFNPKKRAYEL